MIRSDQSTKSTEREFCWNRDEGSCVRLELQDGAWLILPYANLQYAWLRPGPPTDSLELRFDTHRALLSGANLRKLALAFQNHEVDSVRVAPLTERMRHGEGPVWVHSIEVENLTQEEGTDSPAPE